MGHGNLRGSWMALPFVLAATPGWAEDPAHAERYLDKGRLELGTAASFTLARQEGDKGYTTILNVPVRLGYFVTPRLELEAELGLSVLELDGMETAVTFSGQALYHFGRGRVVPYVMAGGGVGNGVDAIGLVGDANETVTHALVGVGLKTFVSSRVAFRTEYRYRHHWVPDYDLPPNFPPHLSTGGNDFDVHRLSVGISVFFR